jgi:methylglutaconyl-CoA hydratase
MESKELVLYEVRDAIVRIALNRPEKRNALNAEIIEALKVALRRAGHDQDVRAVILTGAGSDFCSGADLQALQKISTASVADNLEDAQSLLEVFTLIRQVRVPVVAAVRGRALAGGCGLATACDLVLAARSARFGYPEVRIGFVAAMVTAILRRNVSEKRAFELLTLGAEIGAEEALELGLVNRVFDDQAFADEVEAFVRRFQEVSRTAVSLSKGLLYQIDGMNFEEALQCGSDTNVIARMTEDCQKGIERFLRKDQSPTSL